MYRDLLDGITQLVYPPECLSCNKSLATHHLQLSEQALSKLQTIGLCPQCQNTILSNRPPFCIKCSRFLRRNFHSSRCSICLNAHPHYDFAWGCCLYTSTLVNLIHQFKYSGVTSLRHLFRYLISNFINKHLFDIHQFDFLIPMPLHSTRQRERGYNQSHILALEISAEYGIPLLKNNLIKTRPTKSQALLRQKERWTNIDGAFRIKHPGLVKQTSILIIDDLLTTGATASEAARTLKSAGVKCVGILTLAITP